MKKIILSCILLSFSFSAYSSSEETCNGVVTKMNNVIEEWHSFVKEYGAEKKNPSVIAMYQDYKSGSMNKNLSNICIKGWKKHHDLYTCLSGVRSGMSAAMCMHPDTNKNNWTYK